MPLCIDPESGFVDKLKYFFSTSVFPHAKLIGRFLTSISNFFGFGVNYGLLKLMGNFTLLAIPIIYYRKSRINQLFFFIPIFILILSPLRNNHWIGPITGYPFLFLLFLLTCEFIIKRKIYLAGLLAFIVCFTHSPGLVVFPIGYLIILFTYWSEKKALVITTLMWTIIFAISAAVYYNLVIVDLQRFSRGKKFQESEWSIKRVVSLMNYFIRFVSLPVSEYNFLNPKEIKSLPILIMAGLIIYTFFKSNFTVDKKQLPWLGLLLFSLTPAVLACLSNDDPSTNEEIVAPRYIMYSIFIWVSAIMFIITTNKTIYSDKVKYIFSVALIIILVPFLVQNTNRSFDIYQLTRYYWGHRLSGNPVSIKGNSISYSRESKVYQKAIENNLYFPRKSDFSKLSKYETVALAELANSKDILLTDLANENQFLLVEWLYYVKDNDEVENMRIQFKSTENQFSYAAEELNGKVVRLSFLKDLRKKFNIKRPKPYYNAYRFFVPLSELLEGKRGVYSVNIFYEKKNILYNYNIEKTIKY